MDILYTHSSYTCLEHAGDDQGLVGSTDHHTDVETHVDAAAIWQLLNSLRSNYTIRLVVVRHWVLSVMKALGIRVHGCGVCGVRAGGKLRKVSRHSRRLLRKCIVNIIYTRHSAMQTKPVSGQNFTCSPPTGAYRALTEILITKNSH